jgi:hypothetical protein
MARPRKADGNRDLRRAPRFPIRVPLMYRVHGEATWRAGKTENISYNGVLFLCEQTVERETRIEINFTLPGERTKQQGAEVVCHGDIVRRESIVEPKSPIVLAARIWDYRLKRGKEAHKIELAEETRSAPEGSAASPASSLEIELDKAKDRKRPRNQE